MPITTAPTSMQPCSGNLNTIGIDPNSSIAETITANKLVAGLNTSDLMPALTTANLSTRPCKPYRLKAGLETSLLSARVIFHQSQPSENSAKLHPALVPIAQDGRWANEICDLLPKFLAEMVGINIVIHKTAGPPETFIGITENSDVPNGTLNLLFINKNHYNVILKDNTIVTIPGDGNCLFAGISRGLEEYNVIWPADQLRLDIATYMNKRPNQWEFLVQLAQS